MTTFRNGSCDFYDLGALSRKLPNQSRFKKLKGLVHKSIITQSCHSDMELAWECFEQLKKICLDVQEEGSDEISMVQYSLLSTAIGLYNRATISSANKGARGAIDIRKKLNPDQLRDHDFVSEIRNKGLAHFYNGHKFQGRVWNNDEVFLVDIRRGWRILGISLRAKIDEEMLEFIERTFSAARQILSDRSNERSDELIGYLMENPLDDNLLVECRIDPINSFLSSEVLSDAVKMLNESKPFEKRRTRHNF